MANRNGSKTGAILLTVIMASSLCASSSLAQRQSGKLKPKSAKEENDARVEKLYNDGVAAAKRQQWEKAEQFFEEAMLLNPDPEIAANLGYAELSFNKPREAAEHLDYYLQEDKSGDAAAHAEVQTLLDQAQTKIVTVRISVDKSGADIYINGFYSGQSPLHKKRIFLNPGKYLFEARKKGMSPGSLALDLQASYDIPVNLIMEQATIGTVLLNGMVQVEAKEPAWSKPLHYGSLGVGLVGLGLSVGFTTGFILQNEALKAQYDELKEKTPYDALLCQEPPAIDPSCQKPDAARRTRNVYVGGAIAGYSLTALGAVGTLIWYVTRPKLKRDTAPEMSIAIGPSGFALQGNF